MEMEEQTPPGPATTDSQAGLRQQGASTSRDPKKLKRMKKKLDELREQSLRMLQTGAEEILLG